MTIPEAQDELRELLLVLNSMLERRRDPAKYEEFGQIILRESEFIFRLIEDLLALARTDAASLIDPRRRW